MPRHIEHPTKNRFMLRVMDTNGFTELKQAAEYLGIPESTAAKWARRESIMPRAEIAQRVAERIGIRVPDLVAELLGIQAAS